MEIAASSIRPAVCMLSARQRAPLSLLKRSTFISHSRRHAGMQQVILSLKIIISIDSGDLIV
jgi:hypothetical protein